LPQSGDDAPLEEELSSTESVDDPEVEDVSGSAVDVLEPVGSVVVDGLEVAVWPCVSELVPRPEEASEVVPSLDVLVESSSLLTARFDSQADAAVKAHETTKYTLCFGTPRGYSIRGLRTRERRSMRERRLLGAAARA
jgi:hypothetical protein